MTDWMRRGRCASGPIGEDIHFGGLDEELPLKIRHGLEKKAKRVCSDCPVQTDCLRYAYEIDQTLGIQYGVWGGLNARERKHALKNRASAA